MDDDSDFDEELLANVDLDFQKHNEFKKEGLILIKMKIIFMIFLNILYCLLNYTIKIINKMSIF